MEKFTRNNGFTLLELMLVISIIGILTSIALPAYKDYVVRAKMTEVINFIEEDKREFLATGSVIIEDQRNVSPYISVIRSSPTNANGGSYVNIAFILDTNKIAVDYPGYTPKIIAKATVRADGSLEWICGVYGGMPGQFMYPKYLPKNCNQVFW